MVREGAKLLITSAALALTGCTGGKQTPAPATQKASTPLENRTPDDAYGRPASVSQPSGTAASDPARQAVPAAAQLVAGGSGELKYTAETDGTLFLVNADTGLLLYRGRVSRGQNVKLDPTEQVLQIENRTVVKQISRFSQSHKMFFQRD